MARLSKTRFVRGTQCPNLLWWMTHERDAPELKPGPALRDRFRQGTAVGALAREQFQGGVLINMPAAHAERAVDLTRDAITSGAPAVFEAAFLRAGIVRIANIQDLLGAAEALAKQDMPKGKRLAVLTNAGGPGVMASDAIMRNRLLLSNLSKQTMKSLENAKKKPLLKQFFQNCKLQPLVEGNGNKKDPVANQVSCVSVERLERSTNGLKGHCSAIELHAQTVGAFYHAHSFASTFKVKGLDLLI